MSKVWIPMTGHIAFGLANGEIKMCDAHHIDGLPFPDDVAICRLTDDAAEVDMPRYSHRNGETEPPTVKGNYWVKGFATINGAIMRLSLMLTVADWRDSAMYAKLPDGGLVTVRGTSTGFASAEWNCEWWGPVMPPWEATNE